MKKNEIIQAWRNEEYFASLSEEERAALPAHPAGMIDMDDDILGSISGGCCTTVGSWDPGINCCTNGHCGLHPC